MYKGRRGLIYALEHDAWQRGVGLSRIFCLIYSLENGSFRFFAKRWLSVYLGGGDKKRKDEPSAASDIESSYIGRKLHIHVYTFVLSTLLFLYECKYVSKWTTCTMKTYSTLYFQIKDRTQNRFA
jgi:hypothetical protein